jgi:hypothetical protein
VKLIAGCIYKAKEGKCGRLMSFPVTTEGGMFDDDDVEYSLNWMNAN